MQSVLVCKRTLAAGTIWHQEAKKMATSGHLLCYFDEPLAIHNILIVVNNKISFYTELESQWRVIGDLHTDVWSLIDLMNH